MNANARPPWQPALGYLRSAADEARRLGHEYVGPEHAFLAVAARPGPVGTAFFGSHGMRAEALRETLATLVGPMRMPVVPNTRVHTTQRCDRALAIAAELTRAGLSVDPDDLLLALLDRGIADDALIGELLLRHGVDVEAARAEVANARAD